MAKVTMSPDQVTEIVRRKKEGANKAAIAAELGIPAERVDVVLCAKGLRGPKSLERYQEADKARMARWLAAHAETVRGSARKMAATPGPKAPAKPRARRSSK